MIEVQTSILCTLLLLKASLISATTYYCQIGNTQTIVGETSGTIRTVESGSSYYGNNFNCNWIINGGTGYKIQLTVTGLNLQHSPSYTSCGTYDHLSIKDGNTSAADEITAICGEKNPYEVISSGQYLYLNFYSNDKNFYDHTGVTVNFQVFGENDCPPNWTSLNTTDKCYKIKQVPGIDWNSAFSNCLYSRANLAVVDHHLVFDNLVAYGKGLPVTSAWVALTDIETEGVFMWLDEQKLAGYISTYENNEDNDCAVLNFDTQRFIMQECERDKHLAVCQRNKVGKTDIYAIPKEKEKETEVFSLRWQIILGITAGVILVLISFVGYFCFFRKSKPTTPGDSGRSVNYRPTNTSPSVILVNQREQSGTNRNIFRNSRSDNHIRQSSPPRYSEIHTNSPGIIPSPGAVHFNPHINVNVTVNANPGSGSPPPEYTFNPQTA